MSPSASEQSAGQSQSTQSRLGREREVSDGSGSSQSRAKCIRNRRATSALCITVFSMALCVRLLHWEDRHLEIVNEGTLLTDLAVICSAAVPGYALEHDYFSGVGAGCGNIRVNVHSPMGAATNEMQVVVECRL